MTMASGRPPLKCSCFCSYDARGATGVAVPVVTGGSAPRRRVFATAPDVLLLLLLLLVAFGRIEPSAATCAQQESYTEELLLEPIGTDKILAHFSFVHRAKWQKHQQLFPRAINQLVRTQPVSEFELTFTHGHWRTEQWGRPRLQTKPVGAELWASFRGGRAEAGEPYLAPLWTKLTHALGGMFCASLNFLDNPLAASGSLGMTRPRPGGALSSPAAGNHTDGLSDSTGRVLYGALPREAVCTENLTPWLKLLPCGDEDGFGSRLGRSQIYAADYHSMRTHLVTSYSSTQQQQQKKNKKEKTTEGEGEQQREKGQLEMTLTQTLTLVLPAPASVTTSLRGSAASETSSQEGGEAGEEPLPPGVSPCRLLDVLFEAAPGLGMAGSCPLAASSSVYFAQKQQQHHHHHRGPLLWEAAELGAGECRWGLLPAPLPPLPRQELVATRHLTGKGDERGSLVTEVFVLEEEEEKGEAEEEGEAVVCVGQVIPWYLRAHLHTMRLVVDGGEVDWRQEAVDWSVVPGKDRKRSTVIELCVALPAREHRQQHGRHLYLDVKFEKAFLTVTEHPPDKSRGFDIPAALVSLLRLSGPQKGDHNGTCSFSGDAPSSWSSAPLKDEVLLLAAEERQQKQKQQLVYTEGLLVPLALPDFSMPYNVTCFSSTLLAIYLGSLFTLVLRRPKRAAASAAAASAVPRSQKAKRLAAIVVAFGALAVYLDKEVQRVVGDALGIDLETLMS